MWDNVQVKVMGLLWRIAMGEMCREVVGGIRMSMWNLEGFAGIKIKLVLCKKRAI